MKRLIAVLSALLLATALGAGTAAAIEVNLALQQHGGTVEVSSEHVPGSSAGVNDGVVQSSGWWTGGDSSDPRPGWATIAWDGPQTISRVVLRMPVTPGVPEAYRTHGLIRLQAWNGSAWSEVVAAGNPIENWVAPVDSDGRQIKTLTFAPLTTTRIRYYEEIGTPDGHYGLEELEAWGGCIDNRALASAGGVVSVSSGSGAAGLNDGLPQASGWWVTTDPGPAWAEIAWASARRVSEIVLRMPLAPGTTSDDRLHRDLRVQQWDGSAWRDVDAAGNPIGEWQVPEYDDGDQIRALTLRAPVTTTKIRVLIERGNAFGGKGLEEIEAYPSSYRCPRNAALATAGGTAISSSEYGPSAALNNGVVDWSGWWTADPWSGPKPDWAGIQWGTTRTLSRIVVRMPVVPWGHSVEERTFGELVLQQWDGNSWEDVDVGGNPIEDWTIPTTDAPDGSEVRAFELAAPLTTTRIRVLFVRGNVFDHAGLEEIEAWTS